MLLLSRLRRIRFEGKQRLLLPIILAVAVKVSMFAWVQWSMIQQPQAFGFHSCTKMFEGWDGGWYNLIAKSWYENVSEAKWGPVLQRFAFAPLFPAMIRVIGLRIGEFTIAQVIVSSFFGIAWIPLFQLAAEYYLDSKEALSVTIIASLFPTVFLFTTVGYSEGLFMTLVLLSWLFYIKGKDSFSSLASAGASLTRFFGVLLIIPMITDSLFKKDIKKTIVYCAPTMFSQIGWALYGYFKTGHMLAVSAAENSWGKKYFLNLFVEPTFLQKETAFPFDTSVVEATAGFEVAMIAIFILLILKTYEVNWKLAVYSLCSLIVIILKADIASSVRYISFIFPIWYLFRCKKHWLVIPVIFTFGLLDIICGYLFARWVFMG